MRSTSRDSTPRAAAARGEREVREEISAEHRLSRHRAAGGRARAQLGQPACIERCASGAGVVPPAAAEQA